MKNQVSVCHKNNCVHAFGKNADRVAIGALLMMLLIGIAAIVREMSK